MRVLSLALLAASAIGAVSIGSASAMPFANPALAQESMVQDVRVVCDRFGRCYNTNRGRYGYRGGYYRGSRAYGYNRGYYPRRPERRNRRRPGRHRRSHLVGSNVP